MNDNSLGIREAHTTVAASELDVAMQPYIDSGNHSKEELAKIRKRLANQLKAEKEREKQERERQEVIKNKQRTVQKVELNKGETATEKLINTDAQKKDSGQYDDSAIDYNKLYTNINPLHRGLGMMLT